MPAGASRRRRRGKKKKEVEEADQVAVVQVVEAGEGVRQVAAAQAASTEKLDNPVPVYKFGPPVENENVEMANATAAQASPEAAWGATQVAAIDRLCALVDPARWSSLLRRAADAHQGPLGPWPPSLPRPPTPPRRRSEGAS